MSTSQEENDNPSPADLLFANLQRFADSGKHSDFTIKTNDSEHRVHKAILCAQSEYFEDWFERDVKKETTETQEIPDDFISFPDNDPKVVRAMIDCMYGRDYTEACGDNVPYIFHAKVYAMADNLGMRTLKQEAQKNFQKRLKKRTGNDRVIKMIPELYKLFPEHADTLLKPVKVMLGRFIHYHMKQEHFRAMLQKVPQLGIDLLSEVAENHVEKYDAINCPGCKKNAYVKLGDLLCRSCYEGQTSKKRKAEDDESVE